MSICKKIIALLLTAVILISFPACSAISDMQELYGLLLAHTEQFTLHTADANALFAETFKEYPALQVYIRAVTIESGARKANVRVDYINTDIKYENIAVGDEDIIETALHTALGEVRRKGAIVLKGVSEQPDPEPYIAGIKQSDYLSVMGLTSSEWSFTTNGFSEDMVVLCTFEYGEEPSRIRECRQQTEQKVQQLAQTLFTQSGDDARLRVLAIHDYIIENTEYGDEDEVTHHWGYGALLEGKAVCIGYTYATHLLLQAAGVYSRIQTGYAAGEEHAWNVVTIDGKEYHLDVTWDDPVGSEDVRYDYFLVDEQTIRKDHNW